MRLALAIMVGWFAFSCTIAAKEPDASQRQKWLDIQHAAIADPDNSAKLNAFLDLLPQVEDDYVVEGDIRMSRDEVKRYLRSKNTIAVPVDPGGELILELRHGQRNYWKPEDRILTYAVKRNSFPSQAEYEKIVALMQIAAETWEKACETCQLDFQHLAQHDGAPSHPDVKFIVEYRNLVGSEVPLALAFFPYDPKPNVVYVFPPFFSPHSYSQTGIIVHELGHVLGYRHEHILSPESGCAKYKFGELKEDATFEPLSDKLDIRSVMHYPCGSKEEFPASLSPTDIEQHSILYTVDK